MLRIISQTYNNLDTITIHYLKAKWQGLLCLLKKRDPPKNSFSKKAAKMATQYIVLSAYSSSKTLNHTSESIIKGAIWIFESYGFCI